MWRNVTWLPQLPACLGGKGMTYEGLGSRGALGWEGPKLPAALLTQIPQIRNFWWIPSPFAKTLFFLESSSYLFLQPFSTQENLTSAYVLHFSCMLASLWGFLPGALSQAWDLVLILISMSSTRLIPSLNILLTGLIFTTGV